MNFSEALISLICKDITNLGRFVSSGIKPDDLSEPYSKIYKEVIDKNISLSREYILVKYKFDIDFDLYKNITVDDVIKNILDAKKDFIIRNGLANVISTIDSTDIDTVGSKILDIYLEYQRVGRNQKVSFGRDVVDDVVERYLRIKYGNVYFKSNLYPIDFATGGIWEGDLFGILGRPGENKTTFMAYILLTALKQGRKCLWINTEMSDESILRKLLVLSGEFEADRLKSGMLNKFAEDRLLNKNIALPNLDKLIFASSFDMDIDDLTSFVLSNRPEILFVDSAYLIKNRANSMSEMVANTIDRLKQIAKDFKICVFFTHQLNRDTDKKKRKSVDEAYSRENIGMSDRVVFNADFVVTLYQTDQDKLDGFLSIKPLKVRDGVLVGMFKIGWDFRNTALIGQLVYDSNVTMGLYGSGHRATTGSSGGADGSNNNSGLDISEVNITDDIEF